MNLLTGEVLDLGSDVGIRRRWFLPASFQHPAKLHLGLLDWIIQRYTRPGDTVLDPMAGIGSLMLGAITQRNVICREIEPKWLAIAHDNAAHIHREAGLFAGQITIGQADARCAWGVRTDHVIFSPPYSCDARPNEGRRGILAPKTRRLVERGELAGDWLRLAKADDTGQTASYLFYYGQHPAQIGHLRDTAYWGAMGDIYTNAVASMRPSGYMVLVIKDHIRAGQHIRIADKTVQLCESMGFRLAERHYRRVYPLSLWQRRRKERGEPVIELEDVLAFKMNTRMELVEGGA